MAKYYTLFIRDEETGKWFDDFGSYKRAEVKEEYEMTYWDRASVDKKIMTNDGTHAGLMANHEELKNGTASKELEI